MTGVDALIRELAQHAIAKRGAQQNPSWCFYDALTHPQIELPGASWTEFFQATIDDPDQLARIPVAMSDLLTADGYEQTKGKLRDLETRLAEMEKRTDLDPKHLASVRRSYKMMIREYLQDIKLYEARQSKQNPLTPA